MKNVLTYTAFADWLEKNPDTTYNWLDVDNCACVQYANHLGIEHIWRRPFGFWMDANDIAMQKPHTFGALAQRLRNA